MNIKKENLVEIFEKKLLKATSEKKFDEAKFYDYILRILEE